MGVSREELISLAQSSDEESDLLDFKREYSPEKKAAFWAETVKDIVAFANTRGGVLVFGVEDDGQSSNIDCGAMFDLDNAVLSDQIRKYTNFNFKGISIIPILRRGVSLPIILVEQVNIPIVFTKVGTYEYEKGKQTTAFSLGTIYVRHGSKSEPCTRDDISEKIQSALERVREEWLSNIRKVVEAEPGATVVVTQGSQQVRLTDDPSAPRAHLPRLSDGYPHRQTDVIQNVNDRLKGATEINSHDIQAIKTYENITPEACPDYMHKPHQHASPQYTHDFIELIVRNFQDDKGYFKRCRQYWKKAKYNH